MSTNAKAGILSFPALHAKFSRGGQMLVNAGTVVEARVLNVPGPTMVTMVRLKDGTVLFTDMDPIEFGRRIASASLAADKAKPEPTALGLVGAVVSQHLESKRTPFVVYPDEFRDKVVERIRDGEAIKAVSRDLGVTAPTISEWCRRADVTSKHRSTLSNAGPGRIGHPDSVRKNAVALVDAGHSYKSVAHKLGVASSSIRLWCKRAGVKSPIAQKETER